jgi:acyl-CoA synthetase (AMP-forming)/AMP-acid ligase II
MLGAVPTQWAELVELPELRDSRSQLRVGICATAPAPPELVERVHEVLGCALIVRYAMTESPSITGTDPGDPPEVAFRTVGRPQGGVEIALVNDDGQPVAAGEVGRVRVRGATVMRGYWRRPAQTAEVLSPDGWLTSGDLGRLTPDGNLVLVGRASDLYIRGGYNVHPLEVENVLVEHPAVDRVSVIGVSTEVIGEIGVAFVVPADPVQPPTLAELRTFVASRLADYKAPDRLEIVDDLPLTPMLKVDKAALRELGLGRDPSGAATLPR